MQNVYYALYNRAIFNQCLYFYFKITPKKAVHEDFFPMSGVSYSYAPNTDPNSVPHVNGKDPFAGVSTSHHL